MPAPLGGFHHITLLAGSPVENVRFHTETLGLRLIKVTVNFDDPSVHHTYFGDGRGTPGTVLTHFPYGDGVLPGKRGPGEARATTLLVPLNTLDGWKARLKEHRVEAYDVAELYFGERQLRFHDPDGAEIRLQEANETIRETWPGMPIPPEEAIVRIGGMELTPRGFERTAKALEGTLGFEKIAEEGRTSRYRVGDGFLDVVPESPGEPPMRQSAGSIHHIAFRTNDDESQREWLKAANGAGLHASDVRDRDYFHSIYFREPGGVLFEIATEGPGFTRDEAFETLGTALKLPAPYEPHRAEIEAALPALR